MSEKLIISKNSFNAGTTTNPDNLIFSSDYSTLKYDISGTVLLSYKQAGTVFKTYGTTVNHNLGYRPFTLVFVDTENTGTYVLAPVGGATLPLFFQYEAFADTNILRFQFQGISSLAAGSVGTAATAAFRYFVFRNQTGI